MWLSGDVVHANQSQTETGIRFTIARDGTTGEMELIESAHAIEVDQAVQGSIVGVGRLPSLPAEFNGPNLVLRIGFSVNSQQQ